MVLRLPDLELTNLTTDDLIRIQVHSQRPHAILLLVRWLEIGVQLERLEICTYIQFDFKLDNAKAMQNFWLTGNQYFTTRTDYLYL